MSLASKQRDVSFMPADTAFKQRAEQTGDNVTEFISLWRKRIRIAKRRQSSRIANTGIKMTSPDGLRKATAVPVDIQYEITMWSRDTDKLANALEEFVFTRYNNPNLLCRVVADDVKTELSLDIKLDDETQDSTNYDIFNKGAHFVYTFNVVLEGWLVRFSDTSHIHAINIKVVDRSTAGEVVMVDKTQECGACSLC